MADTLRLDRSALTSIEGSSPFGRTKSQCDGTVYIEV